MLSPLNQEVNKIVKTLVKVPLMRIHTLITRVRIVLDIAIYGNVYTVNT